MEPTACRLSCLLVTAIVMFAYYVGVFIYLNTLPLEDKDAIAMLLLWIYPFLGITTIVTAYVMGMALWGCYRCLMARDYRPQQQLLA
jgi:hypothetical protein